MIEESETVWAYVQDYVVDTVRANPAVAMAAVWAGIRALGTTVKTGTVGLFFSFGRAKRVVEPGLVLTIPYFQTVRVMPSRSRTLDVPDQKVTSTDGLVWFVDVNLIYRMVDIRKALIEVDDLTEGMKQMLSLSVQEIVRGADRETMRHSGALDSALRLAMEKRLEPWGVDVERAGFVSVRPSKKTLRITQLLRATEERERMLERLEGHGLDRGAALAMLGSAPLLQRRAVQAREREGRSGRKRRILLSVRRAIADSENRSTGSLKKRIRARVLANL
ncbi:MAG: hypothetical protein ACI8X5_001230 [Planctomycetota bacterium]